MRIVISDGYRHDPIEELTNSEKLRRACEKVFENPAMYDFSGGFFINENGRTFQFGSNAPIYMQRLHDEYLVERSVAYNPRNTEEQE